MPETYHRKRVEIVVENTVLELVQELLEDVGISGYSVMPISEGQGEHGIRRSTMIIPSLKNVMVLVITTDEKADELLERIGPIMDDVRGIVFLSDVSVLRAGRFN